MPMYGIKICTALSAAELRRRAGYEKKRRPGMRMRAIANALDGYDRKEAARLEGMSDQALRDAIKRYNEDGLAGLKIGRSLGARASSTRLARPSCRKRSSMAPIRRPTAFLPTRSTIWSRWCTSAGASAITRRRCRGLFDD